MHPGCVGTKVMGLKVELDCTEPCPPWSTCPSSPIRWRMIDGCSMRVAPQNRCGQTERGWGVHLTDRSMVVVLRCTPPSVWPHLFCGADHEKRRGEQLKWSLAFRLLLLLYAVTHAPFHAPVLRPTSWPNARVGI